jgi:zinc/manganese transport system substrate-binding protein
MRTIASRGAGISAALLTAGLLGSGLVGCSTTASDRPTVVVTTNILADVVERTVGGEVDVVSLMPANADPHSFEISARDSATMRDADLVVSNGLGLEEGVQQHVDAAAEAGAPVLVAGDHIEVLDYVDGASSGAPDPHFWTDPERVLDVIDTVRDRVARIDGVDAAAVSATADDYRAEVEQLDLDMTAAFDELPADDRDLVTNHHVFGYLAERFGFRVIGAIVPSGTTLAAPSASDLRDLVSAIEEADVPVVFADSSSPDRLAQVLADEADIDVDVVPLITESLDETGTDADSYIGMMRVNTERITSGLSP